MNKLLENIASVTTKAAEVNRDIQRKIIPQPRSGEVTIHSPWDAPSLGIALRRVEKAIGAVDTAIRTSRGDIARERLLQNNEQEYINPRGLVTRHSSELLLHELSQNPEVVQLEDLHELLSTQAGDLSIDNSILHTAAGIGKAYFIDNPADETVDIAKIPASHQHYVRHPGVAAALQSADKKRIKTLQKEADVTLQEEYFRRNLGMVVDAIVTNRKVNIVGRATLRNYVKHEAKFWASQAHLKREMLNELEKPAMSREEWESKVIYFSVDEIQSGDSLPGLLEASEYYQLENSITTNENNAKLYDKFSELVNKSLENYRPEPGSESETAGYHPYRPPRYIDGEKVKFVDGRPMPAGYDSETGQYSTSQYEYPTPTFNDNYIQQQREQDERDKSWQYVTDRPQPDSESETSQYGQSSNNSSPRDAINEQDLHTPPGIL